MDDLCADNRFDLIEKYKKKLIEATNIETRPEEMAVLESILFRFWQMGWLDKLEQLDRRKGKWINAYPDIEPNPMFMYAICSICGCEQAISDKLNFCPDCGSDMRGGIE